MKNEISQTSSDFYIEQLGACIYAIVNRDNGKRYIGQAVDFKHRLNNHFYMLRAGKHEHKEMQEDYNSGHTFEAIRLCRLTEKEVYAEQKNVLAIETYFILHYNSVEKGYNRKYNYPSRENALRAVERCKQFIGVHIGVQVPDEN